MKTYTSKHHYHCGVDLHKKNMYICLLNQHGEKLRHCNLPTKELFRLDEYLEPCHKDVDICCEATYNWYRLADFCEQRNLTFVLAHAAYLRSISVDKKKSDREDSLKIASYLRNGLIPLSWACPREWRGLRSLLRHRISLVREQTRCKNRLRLMESAWHLKKEPGDDLSEEQLQQIAWGSPGGKHLIKDYELMQKHRMQVASILSEMNCNLEEYLSKDELFRDNYQRLLTVPGIGPILAAVILLESGPVERFARVGNYSSYCLAINCRGESGGKTLGSRGRNNGNLNLKWAYTEVAVRGLNTPIMRGYFDVLLQIHAGNKRKCYAILRNKMVRSVYFILRQQKNFEYIEFFGKRNCRHLLKLAPGPS